MSFLLTHHHCRHCADHPAVQKLITKAVEETRAAALKEAAAARAKADKEINHLRKDHDRMTAALAKFKERYAIWGNVSTDPLNRNVSLWT